MTIDILLVAAEWKLRALLRAQLIEEGLDVQALDSCDEAELLLLKHAVDPRAIVVDLHGESNPQAILATFSRIAPKARVLVLTSPSTISVDEIRALGVPRVIVRPFAIRDVVAEAKSLVGPVRESPKEPAR